MKNLLLLTVILFILSCKQSKNDTVENISLIVNEVNEKRVLYSFKPVDLSKSESYILTIRQNDKFIVYSYVNINDERKNMRFSINKKNEKLHCGPEIFTIKKGKYIVKENNEIFNFYWQNLGASHQTRPLLFNKEYGVLGIYNSYGLDFIYLKEKTEDLELLKEILISMENYNPN